MVKNAGPSKSSSEAPKPSVDVAAINPSGESDTTEKAIKSQQEAASYEDADTIVPTGEREAAPDRQEAPKKSRFQQLKESAFWRKHMAGEIVEEEGEKKAPESKLEAGYEITKAFGYGAMSAAFSLAGAKFGPDLVRYISQKTIYKPAERKRLKEMILGKETVVAPDAIDARVESINAAIDSSKHLTAKQKEELKQEMKDVVDERDMEIQRSEKQRNDALIKLIDEAVDSRIKGTTVLKEGVNAALMASWVSGAGVAVHGARSIAYGAASWYERKQQVLKEIEKGERKEGYYKEMYWNVLSETAEKLGGGDAEHWAGRLKNRAEAAGTIVRALGFTGIAFDTSDEMRQAFDTMFDQLIPEAAAETAGPTLAEVMPEIEPAVGAEVTPGESLQEAAPDTGEMNQTEMAESLGMPTPEDGVEPERFEFNVEQGEIGTIKRGDGIVKVVERQLLADAEANGFNPEMGVSKEEWATERAMELAENAGMIFEGGDFRLTSESIGKLSITVEGDQLVYWDAENNVPATDEQLNEWLDPKRWESSVPSRAVERVVENPLNTFELKISGESVEIDFTYDGGEAAGYDRAPVLENLPESYRTQAAELVAPAANAADEALREGMIANIAADMYVLDTMRMSAQYDSPEYYAVLSQMTEGVLGINAIAEDRYPLGFVDIDTESELGPYFAELAALDADRIPMQELAEQVVEASDRVESISLSGAEVTFDYAADGSIERVNLGDLKEHLDIRYLADVNDAFNFEGSDFETALQKATKVEYAAGLQLIDAMEQNGLAGTTEYRFVLNDFVNFTETLNASSTEQTGHEMIDTSNPSIQYLFQKAGKIPTSYEAPLPGTEAVEASAATGSAAEQFQAAAQPEAGPAPVVAAEAGTNVVPEVEDAPRMRRMARVKGDPFSRVYGGELTDHPVEVNSRGINEGFLRIGRNDVVQFEYQGDQVVGLNSDMRYSQEERMSALALVDDERGAFQLTNYAARDRIMKQAYELSQTEKLLRHLDLEDSAEYEFVDQALDQLVRDTNRDFEGQFHLSRTRL